MIHRIKLTSWSPELLLASEILFSMDLAMNNKFVFCESRTYKERWKLRIKLRLEKQVDNMWIVSSNESRLYFTFVFVTDINVHASLLLGISCASEYASNAQRGQWNLI
jgi:hypothetical protein